MVVSLSLLRMLLIEHISTLWRKFPHIFRVPLEINIDIIIIIQIALTKATKSLTASDVSSRRCFLFLIRLSPRRMATIAAAFPRIPITYTTLIAMENTPLPLLIVVVWFIIVIGDKVTFGDNISSIEWVVNSAGAIVLIISMMRLFLFVSLLK